MQGTVSRARASRQRHCSARTHYRFRRKAKTIRRRARVGRMLAGLTRRVTAPARSSSSRILAVQLAVQYERKSQQLVGA